MAQSVFPVPSSASTVGLDGVTIGASGTFALPKTYPAGLYKVVTDSTQTMTLTFDNTNSAYDGYPPFTGSIRGGYGYVSFPYDVNTIVIPAGLSYGFLLTLDQLNTPTQLAAPTDHAVTWNSTKTQITGTWSSVPSGTQTITFYYVVAGIVYSVNFNSTTSGATATIATAPPAAPGGMAYGILCTNTAGVKGVMGTGTTGAVPSATTTVQFTSSTTWVAPFTGSLTDVLVVAGGGRGGGSGVPGAGGGGGAGGYRTSTTQTVTNGTTYAVTVGSAGGGSSSWNATSVGSPAFSASGGGNGTGSRGGSGGGGAGNGYGGSGGGLGNIGNYTPAEGTNGQGVGSSTDRGSGGGLSATNSITGTPVVYAVGGNGGSSTYGSGGYGGGYNGGDPGGPGVQGTVVIKYNF